MNRRIAAWALALTTAGWAAPAPAAGQLGGDTIWLEGAMTPPPRLPGGTVSLVDGPVPLRSLEALRAASIPRRGRIDMIVIPAQFADSGEPPFPSQRIADALFGPGASSIPRYFSEASRGVFTAGGAVAPWVRTSITLLEAAGSVDGHGLIGPRLKEFVTEAIELADASVDFGLFDNDGEDGRPNSGDDNGVVDGINIEFDVPAGSCPGGPGVWPHFSGVNVVTNDRRPNGGFVEVRAYFMESAIGCDGTSLQTIGTVAHEFGHLLGLPDFYRMHEGILPSQRHWNIGCFGIMGAGAWGCGSGPTGTDFGPTHPSPLSKVILDWLHPIEVPEVRNRTYLIGPVQTTGDALRIVLDAQRNEYFLVEFRPQLGFDAVLPGTGVLIYHVDLSAPFSPEPSEGPMPYRYHLVEADGDYELRRVERLGGNRGEAEDMFGHDGRERAVTQIGAPTTHRHDGQTTPIAIHEISVVGDQARVRVSTHPVPGFGLAGGGVEMTALTPYNAAWPVYGGIPPYQVEVADAGALPVGLDVTLTGDVLRVEGTPASLGSGKVLVRIRDSVGRQGTEEITLAVIDPVLAVAELLRLATGGSALDPSRGAYLDASGNQNGGFDLGDVRAYLGRTGRWYER